MSDNPASVLFDSNSVELSVTASASIPEGASGLLVAGVGTDGIVRYPVIDSSGLLHVSSSLPTVVSVGGQYASGSVTFGNPLFVAGSDGTTLHPLLTDSSGRLITIQKASSASLSSVSSSVSNTQVLAANALRAGATIYNGADVNMYLAFNNLATTASYTVIIGSEQYYEVPAGYTGMMYAVWDTDPEGYAHVTEIS